jgi:hypothetical protein
MSRSKVGYDFYPVPQDIAPEWAVLPYQTRMLGVSLWMLGRGEPIPVPGNWVVYLCGKLEITGPDRPNISRSLLRLRELGLLSVCDGSATCLLRVCQVSAACLPLVCTVSDERKAAKSFKAPSTEEKRLEETDKTITEGGPSVVSAPPAWVPKSTSRPDLDGFNWFLELKGGQAPPLRTCKLDYEWIGGRPLAERHQVAQNIAATQWCADNRKNVTPAHVVKYWESYVEGPRNRQQLAVSVNPLDVAHGLMKSAEKAYHEAHRYNEPIEPALKAWEAATDHYNALSKARAS